MSRNISSNVLCPCRTYVNDRNTTHSDPQSPQSPRSCCSERHSPSTHQYTSRYSRATSCDTTSTSESEPRLEVIESLGMTDQERTFLLRDVQKTGFRESCSFVDYAQPCTKRRRHTLGDEGSNITTKSPGDDIASQEMNMDQYESWVQNTFDAFFYIASNLGE